MRRSENGTNQVCGLVIWEVKERARTRSKEVDQDGNEGDENIAEIGRCEEDVEIKKEGRLAGLYTHRTQRQVQGSTLRNRSRGTGARVV